MRYKIKLVIMTGMLAFASALWGQNGPTLPTVTLKFVQSTSTGITGNCIYRATGATSIPAPPAIFCSTSPIVTWTDTTVAPSTTYVYAVTAKAGAAESAYSNSTTAITPANPNPPSGVTTVTITITTGSASSAAAKNINKKH
jgi:hypothetical protein